MSDSSDSEPKHLDATKPGVSPVSHTSKPALVSSPQLSRDPMMRESGQPESDIPIQEHKKADIQPSTPKSEIESQQSEQSNDSSNENDQDLPEGVIEKDPVLDQQSEKLQNLIDKKTYNVPIKPEKTKVLLKVVVTVAVLVVVVGVSIAIFVMK